MLEQLSPSRALGELAWGDTGWIGNTRGCFERQLTCGVCGQNNLKINNLRRGRSPSGCNHFPETCPANGSMSLAGRPFLLKSICCRNPATVRLEERDKTLNGIYSRTGATNSIALKPLQREIYAVLIWIRIFS